MPIKYEFKQCKTSNAPIYSNLVNLITRSQLLIWLIWIRSNNFDLSQYFLYMSQSIFLYRPINLLNKVCYKQFTWGMGGRGSTMCHINFIIFLKHCFNAIVSKKARLQDWTLCKRCFLKLRCDERFTHAFSYFFISHFQPLKSFKKWF